MRHLHHDAQRRSENRDPQGTRRILTRAICETLESRRLLTTHTYVVPGGHDKVFLRETSTRG